MIGFNIRQSPALFLRAFEELDLDIAVHTWSHRHMPTLTNLEIVAELGWTMEIIRNSTVSAPGFFPITGRGLLSSRSPGWPAAEVLETTIWRCRQSGKGNCEGIVRPADHLLESGVRASFFLRWMMHELTSCAYS